MLVSALSRVLGNVVALPDRDYLRQIETFLETAFDLHDEPAARVPASLFTIGMSSRQTADLFLPVPGDSQRGSKRRTIVRYCVKAMRHFVGNRCQTEPISGLPERNGPLAA